VHDLAFDRQSLTGARSYDAALWLPAIQSTLTPERKNTALALNTEGTFSYAQITARSMLAMLVLPVSAMAI